MADEATPSIRLKHFRDDLRPDLDPSACAAISAIAGRGTASAHASPSVPMRSKRRGLQLLDALLKPAHMGGFVPAPFRRSYDCLLSGRTGQAASKSGAGLPERLAYVRRSLIRLTTTSSFGSRLVAFCERDQVFPLEHSISLATLDCARSKPKPWLRPTLDRYRCRRRRWRRGSWRRSGRRSRATL